MSPADQAREDALELLNALCLDSLECELSQLRAGDQIADIFLALAANLDIQAERLRVVLKERDEAIDGWREWAVTYLREKEEAEAGLLRAEEALREAHEREKATLTRWYRIDPVTCATFCDEVLDRSGALLVRVREWHRAALSPEAKEDEGPPCHICGTTTDVHAMYCSAAGGPSDRAALSPEGQPHG